LKAWVLLNERGHDAAEFLAANNGFDSIENPHCEEPKATKQSMTLQSMWIASRRLSSGRPPLAGLVGSQ
jgi:hypothetical protein